MEPQPKQQSVIENIEIDLLLEAIYRRWGYDFRSYARASMVRRIGQFMSATGFTQASAIIPQIIHDKALFSKLVGYFSVSVTEMFRDPFVYRELREKVIPLLRTWPHIKIWHAGCATGEEVYSLAILLKEEGIYHRATIYATDFNEEVLDKAREACTRRGPCRRQRGTTSSRAARPRSPSTITSVTTPPAWMTRYGRISFSAATTWLLTVFSLKRIWFSAAM
ncbi:CheR family methyltransferase [Desulfosarcina cetonica]|uniref:CheR family methyltransferase n=1 Tax=Desulfosarcina cetonica TaxID=90730 RepID=UPI000AE30398|nr:CheR family methyltransferase [Desulfosarcina cetonica]